MSKNFEPYLDWDAVTQDMSNDLHEKVVEYRKVTDEFCQSNDPKLAAELMRLQWELTNLNSAILKTLYTLPMMVHLAGEKVYDTDEEGHKNARQLCKRCGSVLQQWCEGIQMLTAEGPQPFEENQVPWWDSGDVVAKATGEDSTTMYQIKDRELDPHERECVDLSGLQGHKL